MPPTSPYSQEELAHFKRLLDEKRRVVLSDLDALEGESHRETDPDPDVPSESGERSSDIEGRLMSMKLHQSLTELLHQIDRSLDKIEGGAYGICEESGETIAKERLEAKPWARFCIRVEEEHEAKN